MTGGADFDALLRRLLASGGEIARLTERLRAATPPADAGAEVLWSWRVVALALEACADGNYGVGAAIVHVDDPKGAVVTGANAMFTPRFNSGAHAEMRALEAFEALDAAPAGECVLYTSLEPCPMCLARFLGSTINALAFVAWDPGGGMVSRLDDMPPVWREIAATKRIAPAACGEDLRRLGHDVFALRAGSLDERLKEASVAATGERS